MNKFIILLLCLGMVIEGKVDKANRCKSLAMKFETCLSRGYVSKLFEGCASGPLVDPKKLRHCVIREKRLAAKWSQCDYQCKQDSIGEDWTPIFNSKSEKVDIDRKKSLQFVLKFTRHKLTVNNTLPYPTPDILLMKVILYDTAGSEIGSSSFNLNEYPDTDTMVGSPRYIIQGTSSRESALCQQSIIDLDIGLVGRRSNIGPKTDFKTIIEVNAAKMFRFTKLSGEEVISVDMSECDTYSKWQQTVNTAATAQLELFTWQDDLKYYFTTEYNYKYKLM